MGISYHVLLCLALITFCILHHASATSHDRNPISAINYVEDATLHSPGNRISAFSNFDLTFSAFKRRIRLALEPNHDILPPGAQVSFLDHNGKVTHSKPIDRLLHKVYRGEAWAENLDGSFSKVGHAAIMVHTDGPDPMFEGSFGIHHDYHHILFSSKYLQTRRPEDPELDDDFESMVIFRDSDIISRWEPSTLEPRRRFAADEHVSCPSDSLDFNTDLDHPVFAGPLDESARYWSVPLPSLFKRQLDTSTGSGNSGGVNLASTIGQSSGCPNTRRVALVGVATDCSYTGQFNGTDAVNANIIQQFNSVSALYEKTFNISIGVAQISVSPAECPPTASATTPWNTACSDGTDIQTRLNTFSTWRANQNDNFSHWTLLTTCKSGTAVGLAWLGQACVVSANARNSTSGAVQTVSGANVVARTTTEWQVVAHETGHTFGAVHDCTSQTCTDGTFTQQLCCPLSATTCDAGQRYIMNPATADGITDFSPCTVGNICNAIGRNSVKTSCFSNNKGVPLITAAQCGNGIVEAGEDCDCGGVAGCANDTCCNPTTCKFQPGAVCDDANEECCSKCQFASANTVCRPSTGSCDPQEVCAGTNGTCPPDVFAPNGQSCGGSSLTCASGQCTSRDAQCQTLMGSYLNGNNDTYACDSQSCTLSCASPQFGPGTCYGLQQNFLDGTPCGGGGQCNNGQCAGSSFGKEVQSWISGHRSLVIGVCVALGVLLLVGVARCAWLSYQRRRNNPFRMRGVNYNASVGGGRGGRGGPAAMSGAAAGWPGQQEGWKDVSPAASSQGSYGNAHDGQLPTLPRVEYGNSAWRYG